jgi:hypothetical protein
MAEFRAAHAAGRDWRTACLTVRDKLGDLGDRFTLGFAYVNDPIGGDFRLIYDSLRESTGIPDWVGAVGYGVCGITPSGGEAGSAGIEGGEYFKQAAMALLVTDLPRDDYRIFGTGPDGLAGFHDQHDSWIAAAKPQLAVVHGDSRNPRTPDLIARLAAESGTFLVGGMASFTSLRNQIAGGVLGGGLSGVMLSSRVAAVSGLSQGTTPLGPVHQVTGARGTVLLGLDGRPALDVLKDDIGFESESEFRRLAPHINIALMLPGSDTGDYVARNLIGIDVKRGMVATSDMVEPGGRVMFCARDRDTAIADLRRVVNGTVRRAGAEANGALYFSCVARGPNLFGPDAEEVRLLSNGLGAVPLAGFYANGEISNNKLYSHTGVLVLFR